MLRGNMIRLMGPAQRYGRRQQSPVILTWKAPFQSPTASCACAASQPRRLAIASSRA